MRLKHFLSVFLTLLTLSVGQMWGAYSATFTRISSLSELSSGDSVLVVLQDGKTPTTGEAIQNNSTNYAAVTISTNGTPSITCSNNAIVWKFVSSTSNNKTVYSFQKGSGNSVKYIAWTSSTTLSGTGTTSNTTTWTIAAISNYAGYFTMNSTGTGTRFAAWSGNKFAAYATNNTNINQMSLATKVALAQFHGALSFYKKATTPSCSEDPTVGNIMNNVSNITATGATFTTSAGVSAGNNCSLSEVGFVYSTSTNPTITTGTKATIANYTSGNLSKSVTGLNDNTTYYVRAFATNGLGTAYSDEKSFKTLELAKYTVSFVTGEGNSTQAAITEASVGAGITLPAAPSTIKCSGDGWEFAGWSETEITSESSSATLLPAGNYKPASDVTLYAVYRKGSVAANATTVTYTLTGNWTTNNGNWTVISGALDGTLANNKYGIGQNSTYQTTTASSPVSITDISSITFSGTKSNTGAGTVAFYYGSGNSWTLIESKNFGTSLTWSPNPNVTGYLKCVFTRTAGNIYMASIGVTGKFPSYTYISSPDCCTELGHINGSFFWTTHFYPVWSEKHIS